MALCFVRLIAARAQNLPATAGICKTPDGSGPHSIPAPKTPAESPSLFCRMGVSARSLNTLS